MNGLQYEYDIINLRKNRSNKIECFLSLFMSSFFVYHSDLLELFQILVTKK